MTEEGGRRIELNIDKIKEMKPYIATPMYGGMCTGMYTKCLMDMTAVFMNHGVQSQIYYLFNESLITRARNYCVANFLKSDATHLFFIDSDIAWKAMDVMYMLHLIAEAKDTDEPLRIFTGLYPKKTIAWEKVMMAAKSGMYDDDPARLSLIAGDMVFNPDHKAYPNGQAPVFEPVKVREAGTGFMIIERSVFEEYEKAYPEYKYTPDHLREGEFEQGEQIMAYFDCIINEQNRYLSEDYMFCENVRKIGIDVWSLPMVELLHTGTYTFQGNLVQMAAADVHATIDPEYAQKLADGKIQEQVKNSS